MLFLVALASIPLVAGHASPWHPSMYGFNVTAQTFNYDNRPVTPLQKYSYEKWWFHNHLSHPPHPEDVFELPVGQTATMQIACTKSATTYYASSEGGNIQDPHDPNAVCPGRPTAEYHTRDEADVKGCALAIAYKSDATAVAPEDFVVFSVNQKCVWDRYTGFAVPEKMPPCPNNKCTCAFFWIHSPDSGSEQMYMNGFQCRVTGSTSNVGLATPKVARRCGADPKHGKPQAVPGNCTYGAKAPLYWFQAERNNMFEGTYAPPFYNDLYNFKNGAQNDIFQGYYKNIPDPSATQTELPEPANGNSVLAIAANTTSADPSTEKGMDSNCPNKKRGTSAFSRHASVERRTPFAHGASRITRRSRSLDSEKRSEIWNPL